MNNQATITKEDVDALADASNELCTAIEVFGIGLPDSQKDITWKMLFRQKAVLWEILAKFGY